MSARVTIGTFILLSVLVLTAGFHSSDAGPAPEDAASPHTTSSTCESGIGVPNPADVYCIELGYRIKAVEEARGEYAECVFPDGSSCDTWKFFTGRCGDAFSYCAKQGYDQVVREDGKDPFSPTYAVCIEEDKEVGSVADLTGLSQRYNTPSPVTPRREGGTPPSISPGDIDVPAAFDWRNYNGHDWMTAVRNQAACGTCWAFSAVGTTEAVYNIATSFPDLDLDLSEEFLNSDCPAANPGSCCGGSHTGALDVIKTAGIPDEACMPYDEPYYLSGACGCGAAGCNPLCNGLPTSCSNMLCGDQCADWASRLITIDDYHYVGTNQTDIQQAIVDHGPLAVCLAMRGTWDAQGIYRCTNCWDLNQNGMCDTPGVCGAGNTCTSGLVGDPCDDDLDCDEDKNGDSVCNQDDCGTNHCVVMVGYDDAQGAWLLKNSWGAGWNGNGYFPIGYGECHIEQYVYYVEPDDLNFPPVADANGPYAVECQGETTSMQLDGSASVDPNAGDTLTYAWTTSCPGGTFDDASSVTPILTLNSAAGSVCPLSCDVTLLVTDQDGASDSATSDVTVQDTVAPALLGVPADETVECDSVPPPAVVMATDTCDPSPAVSFDEVRVDGACPESYTLERTWTATDACGNSSSQTQVITVQDTTGPIIACNAPVTIIPPDAPISFTATATDNCDGAPFVRLTAFDCFKYLRNGRKISKLESCVVSLFGDTITIFDSGGVATHITWNVSAVDGCGNVTEQQCEVVVARPGHHH